MEHPSGSAAVSVSLVSPHPLALHELTRLLRDHEIRVQSLELDSTATPTLPPEARQSPVCVVDGFTATATEGVLAELLLGPDPTRVIVLARGFEMGEGARFLRMGVKGLVPYQEASAQLARAVLAVSAGGYWASRSLIAGLIESVLDGARGRECAANGARLSPREKRVLEELVGNLSNKEIAARLNISERTVKFHVSNLLSKFKVTRRSDLVLRTLHVSTAVQ